jgi:hypothetical protein
MSAIKISKNVADKAVRLEQGNRVILLAAFRAVVIGDTGTYDVTNFGGAWKCNCKWGQTSAHRGSCSHIEAVKAATPETQAPVASLAQLLNDGLAKRQAEAQAQLAADEAELNALFSF